MCRESALFSLKVILAPRDHVSVTDMKKGNSINPKKADAFDQRKPAGTEPRSQAQVEGDSEKLKCGMGKEISLSTQL